MTDPIDIYRAAKVVIDRDGEDAQLYASARTVSHAGEGDYEGAPIWRQIAAAVEEVAASEAAGRGGELITPGNNSTSRTL